MPAEIINPNTVIDDALAKSVYFYMFRGLGGGAYQNNPFLPDVANTVLRAANLDKQYQKITFQFPPHISSDTKGAAWKEIQSRQAEPISIFYGGTPRTFDLKWTYIVDYQPRNDIVWTVYAVSQQVKSIRSYFYNMAGNAVAIRFRAYDIVGESGGKSSGNDYWTFRSDSVSMTYSDTLIRSTDKEEDPNRTYPLRTDITMQMKFFVNGTLDDWASKDVEGDDKAKQLIGDINKPHTAFLGIKGIPTNLKWL